MPMTKKGVKKADIASSDHGAETEKISVSGNGIGLKALILAALGMGIIAAASGWFLGQMFGSAAQNANLPEQQLNKSTSDSGGIVDMLSDNPQIVQLAPIVTTLREPDNARIRMEIALVMQEEGAELELEQMAEITNDFIALIRQMTLLQIKGATGLMNLRDDFLERARLRSEGKVSALLISNLVIE